MQVCQSLHSRGSFNFFLVLFKVLVTALMDVIGLAAIFEAIDAIAKQAALTLAVVNKNLVIERFDKRPDCLGLPGLDVFPIKDCPARGLAVPYTVQPALDFALDLPEQIFFI